MNAGRHHVKKQHFAFLCGVLFCVKNRLRTGQVMVIRGKDRYNGAIKNRTGDAVWHTSETKPKN